MGPPKLLFWRFLGARKGPGTPQGPNNSFIPVLNRFGTDFGPIWDRIWTDLGTILNGFWIDFWMMFQVFVACYMLFVVCCLLLAACCWLFVVYLGSFAPLLFVIGCFLLSVVSRVLFKLFVCFFVRWLFVVSSLRDVHRTFAHSPGPAECAKRLE